MLARPSLAGLLVFHRSLNPLSLHYKHHHMSELQHPASKPPVALPLDRKLFRRNGQARKPLGIWLRKAAPVALRVVKGAALGIVDGIPGVSQVVNTVTAGQKVNGFSPVARVTFGWSTVGLIVMLFGLRYFGQLQDDLMITLMRIFLGF